MKYQQGMAASLLAALAGIVSVGGIVGAGRAETVGSSLVDRSFVDGASGYMFLYDNGATPGFSQTGVASSWSILNDTGGTGGRQLEPLILKEVGSNWEITGKGAIVTTPGPNPPGLQNYAFNLAAGSAYVGNGYTFAHHDLNNPGSIEFDNGGVTRFFSLGTGTATIGTSIPDASFAGGRTYSVQVSSTPATTSTTGDALVDRASNDAGGGLFANINTPFVGEVVEWSFFDNDGAGVITPLIIERLSNSGPNSYQVVGVGKTRVSTAAGTQTYPFGLVAGSAQLSANRFIGWFDGNNADGAASPGTIDFDGTAGGGRQVYFGGGFGAFTSGLNLTPDGANPVLIRDYSVQTTNMFHKQIVGHGLADRSLNDTASGSIFMLPEALVNGRLSQWAFFDNDDFSDGPSGGNRVITPLLMEFDGANYLIRGIGTTRTSAETIGQSFDFGLVSGTDQITGSNFFFGWKDGSNGFNNEGVVDWDAGGTNAVWWFGTVNSLAANAVIGAGTFLSGRTYSIQALVPEPNAFALAVCGALGAVRAGRKLRKRELR